MIIFVMGPQGSGKGTQAKRLAEEFGFFYLDAGSLLRTIAKSNRKIDELVNKRGALVPDSLTFKIITDYLQDMGIVDNIIFDGYPRSIRQYNLLKKWLKKHGSGVARAIFLNISEKETIKRLSARRLDPKTGKTYNLITNKPPKEVASRLSQREDDKPNAIKQRLKAYRMATEPLVAKLTEEGLLIEVNGERPIETIHSEMKKDIEILQGNK